MGWVDGGTDAFFFTWYAPIVTVILCIGAMIAAGSAGSLTRYGKWNMIHLTNVLIIVAAAVCMIDNIYVILLGKFLYGMGAGAMTVFCTTFVNEIAPEEYKGLLGTMN